MINYRNLDIIYTVQWPFDHFGLKEKDYIVEHIAKEKFEKKEFFIQVFFEREERVFCIDFEINFIRVTIYKNQGPYYEYVFSLEDANYKKVHLRSIRERNLEYKINKDGFVYITERGRNIKDTKNYRKKYMDSLLENICLDFNKYDELLKWIENLNIDVLIGDEK